MNTETSEQVRPTRVAIKLEKVKAPCRRVRVAINAISDLTSKYGSYVYLIELSRILARSEGIDLLLLVGRGATQSLPDDLRSKAYEVPIPASRSYWQAFYHKQIEDVLLREKVDVYHLPNTLPFFRKVVPTVVSIHDLADLRLRKYGFFRTKYRWLINYSAAKVADRVLTLSENSKEDLNVLLRVPKEKVTVTFAGVDKRFRLLDRATCKERVRRAYHIDSHYLLAPGGLSRNKNIVNLVAAFSQLKLSHPDISLVLTGYGSESERRDIVRQSSALGLKDSVILTGYVDVDQMPFLYGACSVVVYPSSYEGFGLPAVEAMASGRPLVVSNASSLPEVTGDAALLVDPNDPSAIASATRRLLDDKVLCDVLISRGLVRARSFTWEQAGDRVSEVYRELVRNPAEK